MPQWSSWRSRSAAVVNARPHGTEAGWAGALVGSAAVGASARSSGPEPAGELDCWSGFGVSGVTGGCEFVDRRQGKRRSLCDLISCLNESIIIYLTT